MATRDLCPTAATESQLCVVPARAHPAFERFYQRPRVVLQKAGGLGGVGGGGVEP